MVPLKGCVPFIPSESEILPQVDLAHVWICKDLVRGSGRQHGALVDDIGPAANPERFPDVMVRDQHADAAVGEVPGDALDVVHRERVDAGKRLVEQDEGRIGRERARDLDAAAFAARQAHADVVPQVRDVQLLEQAFERLVPRGVVEVAARLEDRLDVVDDRQVRKIDGSCGR